VSKLLSFIKAKVCRERTKEKWSLWIHKIEISWFEDILQCKSDIRWSEPLLSLFFITITTDVTFINISDTIIRMTNACKIVLRCTKMIFSLIVNSLMTFDNVMERIVILKRGCISKPSKNLQSRVE
jgi:hypothetical protein